MAPNILRYVWFPIAVSAGIALAIDPSPAAKAKWDAKCVAKSGSDYAMVFNPDGTPTGRCEAPPKWACYFGPYTDPKTGKKECCGKNNGAWSADTAFPLEGACCVAPTVFSFDDKAKKGACCDPGMSWHVDTLTGSGSCCSNADNTYECSCQCKDNSKPNPPPPAPAPSPNPPSPPPAHCPDADEKIATVDGVEYKFYCNNGYSAGRNVLKVTTAKDGADCAAQCSAEPTCQGVNFFDDGQDDGCVMTDEHESPPLGSLPGGPFLCAIPTNKRV